MPSLSVESGENKLSQKQMFIESSDTQQKSNFDFSNMEECDIRDIANPQVVSEYAVEIFEYLRTIEVIIYLDLLNLDRINISLNPTTWPRCKLT